MTVTSFKLAIVGRVTDVKGSMDPIPTWSRTDRWLAVWWQRTWTFFTERTDGSHWQRWSTNTQLAIGGRACVNQKTEESRDSEDKASPKLQHILHYCVTITYFMPFHFLQLKLKNPIGILTKNNKITIACFKPTISVGFDPYSRKVLLGRPSALAG